MGKGRGRRIGMGEGRDAEGDKNNVGGGEAKEIGSVAALPVNREATTVNVGCPHSPTLTGVCTSGVLPMPRLISTLHTQSSAVVPVSTVVSLPACAMGAMGDKAEGGTPRR